MNGQEKKWFEELQRDREDSRKTLQKPSMSGVQRSVVEKYSDEAHFIYELLQNADDAKATWVKFILETDKLIFIHNGTRHFDISDPQKEDIDKANKSLGDINAITSVGNSSKESEATIGKFGVGFKAVFQYTSTPCIYDDKFRFKINDLIVPTLIKSDHPNRNNGETLFEFPFNHELRLEDEAYDEIKDKLNHLNHPTLFLDNLKSVIFECNDNDAQTEYKKRVIEKKEFCSALKTHAQRIILTEPSGLLTEPSGLVELWLFKRKYNNLDYCVAFKIIEDSLVPIKEPAYCYFPTQVDTGLNFIIHAAFLLTDSREGIKAGDEYNNKMINKLAELAADSIVYLREISEQKKIKLINESILDIIPIQESYLRYNRDRISFNPFYEKIKQTMCTERVLPTKTGYTSKEHAYWAETPDIMELFSDKQLKVLTGDDRAAWIFSTKGSKNYQQANRPALLYIKSLYKELFVDTDQSLFNKLNNNHLFIQSQPIEWFRHLYRWICDDRERKKRARKHNIFINRLKEAVPMLDPSGKDCLFLPFRDIKLSYSVDDASFVREEFAEDNEVLELLKELGVREYLRRDYVYKLLKEKREYVDDLIDVTKLIFDYYCECSFSERNSFLQQYKKELCEFQWLTGYNEKKDNYDEGVSNDTYYPTQDLIDYFNLCRNLSDIKFLYISEYVGIINNREPTFIEFLKGIGFGFNPKLIRESISYDEAKSRGLPQDCSEHSRSYPDRWMEKRLIGCVENIHYIIDDNNQFEERKYRSILLWRVLSNCISNVKNDWYGEYCYTLYRKQTENSIRFESIDVQMLKNLPWLINNQNRFVSVAEITQQSMSLEYVKSEELFGFLEIRSNEERYIQLTDKERESIEFGKWIEAEGLSSDELKLIINEHKSRMSRLYPVNSINKIREPNRVDKCNDDDPIITDRLNIIPNCNKQSNQVRVITNDIEIRVDKLNSKRHRTPHSTDVDSNNRELQSLERGERFDDRIDDFDAVDEEDYDDFNPRIVDYQKKIEKEKDAAATRISNIQKLETLEINARNGIRYSFEWFKTLLEIEMNNQSEDVNRRKKIAISFGKIEREPDTERTYILRFPNRYIPNDIEELSGFPMSLRFGKQSRDNIIVEAASIRSFTLRVKLRDKSQISDIPLDKVNEINITADSPDFLLKELSNGFNELGYPDDYDMMQNLTLNIEFVYGPPGTGKTTYLCNEYLIDWLTGKDDFKILVLAPTNKSADVIVNRLISIMDGDDSYRDWLIRFGSTFDDQIDKKGIYKDRMCEFNKYRRAVVVTTIARFPYDYFIQRDSKIYLKDIPWDYIVIDEASMIPLASIIYPLYKSKPEKFVIAGDPFQIQPIVTSDFWKDENIYTMVGLKSFICPKTEPHDYPVETLRTQYRSIPCIGKLFSQLTYDGVLKHHREHGNIKQLNLSSEINLRPLTIVKYPTSKYDSIYKCKRLNNSSPYHIYSALFAYEFSNWLSQKLLEHNPDTHYSIGIISPYKIQASLVDRLLARTEITDNVDIQAGTIHGFQGDECDIIIALFNPPPSISSNCFLNNLNIINVAISRARDYLIMFMPDDNTENVFNLRLIKQLEQLMSKSDEYVCYSASEIEQIMFDNPHFLEDNSFSTNHQSVNVYARPERKYEVRCEDSAVDIQIHME